MASFFRKRIAQKVLSLLQGRQEIVAPKAANLISSVINVNEKKSSEPELILDWKRIESMCYPTSMAVSPKELVRLLRNQGLPTAEGFINIQLLESPLSLVFTVDKHIFSKIVLLDICTNDENLAKSSCIFEDVKKKNIVVQSSFPAVGDPFHVSFFCTAIRNQFVTNVNKFAGHSVTNVAQVNDWGLRAAIFLTGYKRFKDARKYKNSALHLFEVLKASNINYKNDLMFKEESDIIYCQLQKGDLKLVGEWQELKTVCMSYYAEVYQKIGVTFDEIHYDSSCRGETDKISEELVDKNILEEHDCSEIKPDQDSEIDSNIEADTSMDSKLYDISRHITAAFEMQKKHNFDLMYYVVPSSQKVFYSLLFSALKKLNYPWAQNVCITKVSTVDFGSRKKPPRNIEVVLDKVKAGMVKQLHLNMQLQMNESLEAMAEQLGLSSLVAYNLKHRRNANFRLDLREVISFKSDSGASFQLCYAGLKRLQEDSEYTFKNDIDTSPLFEAEAHYLIQHLARFDEAVYKSYILLEPCIIFQYLYSLWYFTDQASNVLRLDIKHDRLTVIKARLLLLSATLKILRQGLKILGISPLEEVYKPEKLFVNENK